MLAKGFAKNSSQLLRADFNTINQVKSLLDKHNQKKLITQGQDDEQLWNQLQILINETIKSTQKQLKQIENKANKIVEQEETDEEQEQQDDNQEQQDDNEEYEDINQEISEIEQENYEYDDDQVDEEQVEDENDDENQDEQIQQYQQTKKFRTEKDNFDEFEKYMEEFDDGKIDIEENEQDDDVEDQEEQNDQSEHGEDSVFDEMREEQLNNKDEEIEQLEQKVLQQKDWQLRGEISAKQRPLNSLIDQDVDFQVNRERIEQSVPLQTQGLEELIKQRVKDELFDDRQKIQLNLSSVQDQKKNEVDTNKSQFGLAEIYERQFKQALGLPTNTSEQKLKQEIFAIFKELSYKLDSLSNLNFEPRGFVKSAEIKVNDLTQKEEKVPFTLRGNVQTGTKTGGILESKEEATVADNKRKHRQVKQRIRNKLREQRRKGMIKRIENKGESKFMYNEAKKGQKRLSQLSSQIKNRESVKFDKSSRFFKNLEQSKESKKISKK